MAIKVLAPGALTTVQDLGRFGYQQFGMPCCGVMDQNSFLLANRLVGNFEHEAVLELTLFGGSYQFDEDTVFALTGADLQPLLNRQPCPMNRAVYAAAGSTLFLGMAVSGCRAYLAAAGGIDVPVVMGSRSTNLKCGLGGYEGRALQAGDLLPVGPKDTRGLSLQSYYEALCARLSLELYKKLPEHPLWPSAITVRVIEGPQAEYFTDDGLRTFYSNPYTVSEQSDRMGCRMNGPAIESIHGTDIISDGIVFGSIQVTSAGQPIILMADRQTTGGYAKIATVCSDDLPALAQCRPGTVVRFRKIDFGKENC